jgi:hypothetical protein
MKFGRGIGKGSSGLQTDPHTDSGKGIRLGQNFARRVLGRQFGVTLHWPLDANSRVAPQQAALVLGVPVVCSLVEKLGRFAGDNKAMRKTRRNPQLALIVRRQLNPHPFAEVRR